MRLTRSICPTLLTLIATAAGGAAQAPAPSAEWATPTRVTHPGRVLDAAGKPVPNAEVVFASADSGHRLVERDVVRATTGKSGRFRVRLWPTRPYRCWASACPDGGDDSATLISDLVDRTYPSTEIRFPDVPRKAATEFRLAKGQYEPWAKHAPLAIELILIGCGRIFAANLDEHGAVAIPPLPGRQLVASVFANGRIVDQARVERKPAEPPAPSGLSMDLEPPFLVRAKVHDIADEGIVGATIERIVGSYPRGNGPFPGNQTARRLPIAKTDDAGFAEWLIAATGDPFEGSDRYPLVTFVAVAPDYQESIAGFGRKPFTGEISLGTEFEAPKTLPIGMIARAPIVGQLPSPTEHPQGRVFLRGYHRVKGDRNSSYAVSDQRELARADGRNGTFLPPSTKFSRHLLHLTNVVPKVPANGAFRRAVVARPLQIPDPTTESGFDVGLANVEALRLQIIDSKSGPAMGAQVICMPLGADGPDAAQVTPAETDNVGRVVFPVIPGRWLVVAIQGGDLAYRAIDIRANHPAEELRLEPMERARLRVVDDEGKPVAGVTFMASGGSWGGGRNDVEQAMNSLSYHLATWSLRRARTDEDGRAEIPFWPNENMRIKYRTHIDGIRGVERQLEAEEEWVEING
ncbi:MAG: carboxypeptidase-like regulatory domain-containing protein [bacterium]|nr:carboxypeptidase-like regulatory domain-containing protein [bacterium]